MIFKLRYAECAQESRSVLGHARVCAGVCGGCVQMCTYVRVCVGVWEYAPVCTGVCRSAWVSVVSVCGINFQNTFWRIESLHQRTLIRILYEFFKKIKGEC